MTPTGTPPTYAEIKAWIESLPADHYWERLPGDSWTQCCPMAAYHKEQGASNVRVHHGSVLVDGEVTNESYHTPPWMSAFMSYVDVRIEHPQRITRQTALGGLEYALTYYPDTVTD
jgi:hypothetical protein